MKSASSLNLRGEANQNHYATASDFQKLFAMEMADFFRLAFLIVADCARTEECLIAAMNDCIHGNSVAEEWIRTWARRVVVRNAIRLVAEAQEDHSDVSNATRLSVDLKSEKIASSVFAEFSAVLALPEFERIVFVLCVLERYSIQDCALLLGKLQRDVGEAKIRALEQTVTHKEGTPHRNVNHTNSIYPRSVGSEELGDADDFCGTLLDSN